MIVVAKITYTVHVVYLILLYTYTQIVLMSILSFKLATFIFNFIASSMFFFLHCTHLFQSDPNLQPVNILESRSIIPSSPLVPSSPALPNNLTRFTPNHKVFCCTMNAVPATNGLLNKLKLPFAIHIHPFRDMTSNVGALSFFSSLSLSLSLSLFLYLHLPSLFVFKYMYLVL